MTERRRITLLIGGLASLTSAALFGCVGPPYEGPPPQRYPPYYYDYYYYPHADVYYHLYSGRYYYRSHGHWAHAQRLPPRIHLDGRRRHLMRIPERDPWRRHEEHRRKYPPPTVHRDDDRGVRPWLSPRSGTPHGRPPGRQLPNPDRRWEQRRDRDEREHNVQRHKEYQRKRGVERYLR
jgi:hypothetical protein